MGEMLERQDWALLVLGAAEGHPLQPVQFQKTLFLVGENVKPVERGISSSFYGFEPYDYGPFDRDVYIDAEQLEREGLAIITTRPGRSYSEYAATAAGVDRARALGASIPPQVAEYINRVVAWARTRTFSEIVRAIYQKYPEQRARSVFNG